ncbi:MAG TPA: hypothetical protein VKU41_25640 [Polyangiaceae bacterium]|nr:hypothetical protein [Polyangiaceae bacterium]
MRSTRPSTYPLATLAKLRRDKVDEAARLLSTATCELERRVAERTRAERRRDDLEREVEGVQRVERDALDRGDLSAADLARADAWGSRVAGERDVLAADAERARTAEQQALDRRDATCVDLRSRRAEARSVDVHRERWEERARNDAEKCEEVESAEAWRPPR